MIVASWSGAGAVDPRVDAAGVARELLAAELLELVEGDHPVAVGAGPSKTTTSRHRRECSARMPLELGDLLGVLGEDDVAAGVGRR